MSNARFNEKLIEIFLDFLRGNAQSESDYNAAAGLKAFIDAIPGGFLIYAQGGDEKIVYANEALIRLFGCADLNEFLDYTQGTFKKVVHPDDLEDVEKSIDEQIETDKNDFDYVEYRIIPKNGVVRWVEDYGHLVRTANAGAFFYVFISDATEKLTKRIVETAELLNDKNEKEKQLNSLIEEYDKERKLIRQEHLQRLEVIEGLSVNYDTILYGDLNGNTLLPYRLSDRLKNKFGENFEVRDIKWFFNDYAKSFVHAEDKAAFKEKTDADYIKRALSNEKTYYINYRCVFDGKIRYMQLRVVNVGKAKTVSQIVLGCRDVSGEVENEMKQKKLLETALENAKLADAAKSAFLSNMSHDMRTPLNAILGYAALAKKNVADPASALDAIERIENAGKQILDLVEKVLKISSAETGRISGGESLCDIEKMLGGIFETIRGDARKKNLSAELDCSRIVHREAYADEQNLKQIITLIANNAVKYTNSGKIKICAAEKESRQSEYSVYEFIISDTGIGIPERFLPRMFDPFERADNTTQSKVFGAGLGLTIAKSLAEAMGGAITVKSEEGKGSEFTFTVSLRAVKEEKSGAGGKAFDAAGMKILIAEDNELNLEIETEILQEMGFETDSAENGKIAVEKIKNSKAGEYSLVIMDIQMPEMDGRTAARAIRGLGDPALSEIPIIALSANALDSDVRLSVEAGMDGHLAKPIDVPKLLQAIERAVEKHDKH